jgi:alkylation response protein AidB-like acyl-CoA dehydrogenase
MFGGVLAGREVAQARPGDMATEVDAAVQMHGALGATHGQAVARLYRDIPALRIYEGATDGQRRIAGRAVLAQAKENDA